MSVDEGGPPEHMPALPPPPSPLAAHSSRRRCRALVPSLSQHSRHKDGSRCPRKTGPLSGRAHGSRSEFTCRRMSARAASQGLLVARWPRGSLPRKVRARVEPPTTQAARMQRLQSPRCPSLSLAPAAPPTHHTTNLPRSPSALRHTHTACDTAAATPYASAPPTLVSSGLPSGACDPRSQRSTWPSNSSRPIYDPGQTPCPSGLDCQRCTPRCEAQMHL